MPTNAMLPWLALGTLLNLFSGGRWAIAVAAWLAPVFLLHFTRLQSPVSGMIWLWLALLVTTYWAYHGLIPAPGVAAVTISALIALANLLPFLVDRLLGPCIPGFVSTLVFPLAWAVVDFAAARLSPYGTWGSPAYTQYGNLPLMQLASVTGTVGITFLMAWFASVINWAWDQHFDWASTHTGLLIYVAACSVALFLGGARLVFSSIPEQSIRVAAIGWPEEIISQPDFMRALEPALSNDERTRLNLMFTRIHDYFLDATRREARAGAKLIVWPEANAMVFQEHESALLERVQHLAREENIHVLTGIGVVFHGATQPFENKAVLIDPAGAIALHYVKAIPVPGFEAQISRRGKPRIETADSVHGKIAAAICYDLDFPGFIRQVGTAQSDLLLVPSSDWEAIKLAHHISAVFRAVENGVPMVRATRWGLSAAVDAQGRVLAQVDPFISTNQAMVAQVAVGGVRTLYARFGDWFGWLCVAGLLALCAWRITFDE
jgi:apolipoprotein N-acyltransferase